MAGNHVLAVTFGFQEIKQGNELLYKNFASCLAAKEANHH